MTQEITILNKSFRNGDTVYYGEGYYDYAKQLHNAGATLEVVELRVNSQLYRITALPNPDPVVEDWREVEKGGHLLIKAAMEYPYIRINWPEWSAAYRKYGAYTELDKQTESRDDYCYECEKFLIRAVALGGRVSVKGGV